MTEVEKQAKRTEAEDAAFKKIVEDICFTAPEDSAALEAKIRTRLFRMAIFLLPMGGD